MQSSTPAGRRPTLAQMAARRSPTPAPSPLPSTVVLGATVDLPGLVSFEWPDVPRTFDLTTFELLIVVLGDPSALDASLEPVFDRVIRALYSGATRVILVGDPTAKPGPWMRTETIGEYLVPWMPLFIPEATAPQHVNPWLKQYFIHVKAAPGFVPNGTSAELRDGGPQWAIRAQAAIAHFDDAHSFECDALVTNGHGDGLAMRCRARFVRSGQNFSTAFIDWIPPAPRAVQVSAIVGWLRGAYAIPEAMAPPWAEAVDVAEARAPQSELDEACHRLEQAEADVARLGDEVTAARRFAALVWETGTPLEELVLDAIERLECSVTRPEVKGEEDGRAVDRNGQAWTVEIKGREGGVKQDDVRAAHAHETEVFEPGEWEGRALLIENIHRLTPPGEREVKLPGNARSLAEKWEVPIVLTSQILDALNALHEGTFDGAAWWAAVAEARGLVELPGAEG